jgi:hypothetical protein
MTNNTQRFDAHTMVYLVVVKLKSQERIVRIDSAFSDSTAAQQRQQNIYLDPRERAEVLAKELS